MEPSQTSNDNPRQAILLDLSLFILDLLDTTKIKENASIHGYVLEVPSALVQMLRDSRVGSPILFLFIYSLLVKIIQNNKGKPITDPRIARLLNSVDYQVRGEAWKITQKIFEEFSSLIDIAPKATLPEDLNEPEYKYKNDGSNYPIRRYDFIGSFSRLEQLQLQQTYTRELNLPEHPLYDQYFSQIYHAQTIGATDAPTPRRKSVSLDGETFKIISDWKGHVGLHEKSDSKLIQDNRNFLEWFISTYIKKELEGIFFDATLELSVAGVLTGSLAGFGISLVTLTGGTIIRAIREAPPEIIDPSWKPVLVGFVALVMFACIIVLARPVWMLTKETPTPLSTPSSTSPPVVLLQGTTPSITLTVPISQVASTQILVIETPFPIKSTTIDNSPNYCLYVIQPNDTLQSVAAWFAVSENEIRNSDRLINWGAFTTHQMIRVNTSCCKSISNNGFSYSVQAGDNIFRLSDKYFTTAEKIVAANNLDNSHYIQAGQMLCIPYP